MADKSSQLILDGLARAAAAPGGSPLFAKRKTPGLFPSNAVARLAAARCKDEGYLHVIGAEANGKKPSEVCAITEKGLAYLFTQVSPKKVLEELVAVLRAKEKQIADLVRTAEEWQSGLAKTQATVARVLQELPKQTSFPGSNGSVPLANGADAWLSEAVSHLRRWADSGVSSDCPLPDLFQQAVRWAPSLTIGQFHDGLRRLHNQERIYLHPWTGPLHEMSEPAYALLVGHEIAYYASARN